MCGGGGHFSPIVNSAEVAIIGVGRGKQEATYINEQWVPRMILPLALSYDHRLIDGADGARFISYIVTALENPIQIALGI